MRWKPFQERFPTDAEWDAAEWRRATGLALIVGAATWKAWPGLWVLDIEAEHRAAGEQWLDKHVAGWRDGVVVETGSGGLHVYALHSGPVQTDSTIPWGEIRGRAAVCVLPPSKHVTGNVYRFLSERWMNLPTIDPKDVPGASPKQSGETFNEPGWAAEWLRTPLLPGSRRGPDGIPKMIGHLRSKNVDLEAAITILEQWDRQNPEPLGHDEIRRHVKSMYGRYEAPGEPAHFMTANGASGTSGSAIPDE